MSQLMRLWYLSHRQPTKAKASLRMHAVSPEASLFTHMKYGSRWWVRQNIRHLAPLVGCTCVWRMSLRWTKSTIISQDGSNIIEGSHFWHYSIWHNLTLEFDIPGTDTAAAVSQWWFLRQWHWGLITRIPVFRVCDQVRLKPACSATEAS